MTVERMVLGLSAESWGLVAFVLAVCLVLYVACREDVKGFLDSLSADSEPVDDLERPTSLPVVRQEAIKARTALWR